MTYEMEKTLPLPKLSVSEAFDLRQVRLYNTGVHVINRKMEGAYFQIWTESEGRRGVNEVCSSLLTFFNVANISSAKLIVWGDSCAGQNKNFATICFWQYMLLSQRFEVIEHKFPEPGHTYLDSDRDFGKVECAVKRKETIYSVDEYQTIMTSAFTKSKATVTCMGDKMVDIANLARSLGLKKQTTDTNGNKIELRDKVRWIRISEFGKYSFKHSFNEEEEWKDVLLSRSPAAHTLPELDLLPRKTVPIKPAKLRDIQKQLRFIPAIYQGLYIDLLASDRISDEEQEDPVSTSDINDAEVYEQMC